MNGLIRIQATISALALLGCAQLHAEEAIFSVGESSLTKPHWQTYTNDLSDQEYRSISRHNQRRVRNFFESYSENTLLAMGIPKTGVKVIGVAAGLAASQDATLYLNKSRFLALEFKDLVKDKRTVFFGIKMDW